MSSKIGFMAKLMDSVEVEWKALGEVGSFIRGKRFVKTDMVSDGFPCIHYGELYTHYGVWASKAKSFVDNELASKLRVANHGDVVIVAAGETIEDIGNGTAWLGKSDAVIHDACFSYKSKLDPKYVSHFLRTSLFKGQIKKSISSGKISAINADGLSKAKIPIPYPDDLEKSLEIQSEIVRILDAFSARAAELAAELAAEITARKKQYKYYRDQLLSFEEREVEWKALGELGEFIRGRRFTKNDYVGEGISAIHYGEIYTRYGVWTDRAFSRVRSDMADSLRFAEPGDVLITGVGETVEDVGKSVAWIGSEKVAIHDDSYAFRHSMNPKFISYAMQTASFIDEKAKHVSRGKVNRLLINGIAKVRIPIPFPGDIEKSLAEQSRIVAILDKFDTLTNSISEDLPREIELRQKQYEYYRDLLFNFPRPKVAA
ncbi:restriction endonuclease subunit S [Steroidobacter agaridevorans]|uniref:restriction endonuclease subunit S n=1 Tax=Steroidobacter agaridevorans TaxID=2695856 RepID=UPI0013229532|nr:restriction endonuclease subunit S [Steroidobacter agaridevorans]GFE89742.1 type I restriction system specificity protein [Steroidobacter agaridevorans]